MFCRESNSVVRVRVKYAINKAKSMYRYNSIVLVVNKIIKLKIVLLLAKINMQQPNVKNQPPYCQDWTNPQSYKNSKHRPSFRLSVNRIFIKLFHSPLSSARSGGSSLMAVVSCYVTFECAGCVAAYRAFPRYRNQIIMGTTSH